MSPNYDFWNMAYNEGWATDTQLREAVTYGDITASEYTQITGEVY